MSVTSEITRLQNAKADLKTAIEGKGVTVPSSTKLDGYSALVDSIETGGGGGGGSEDVFEYMAFKNETRCEAPLGEKNLLISLRNNTTSTLSITVTNSSTSKHFTYSVPRLKTYYFISFSSTTSVYVSTGTVVTIMG